MTWFQLWKRIGKQPLRSTQHKDVTIKLPDGEYKCVIVYTDNGSDWHLELSRLIRTRGGTHK
jgi:hypothetical protein